MIMIFRVIMGIIGSLQHKVHYTMKYNRYIFRLWIYLETLDTIHIYMYEPKLNYDQFGRVATQTASITSCESDVLEG